MKHDSRSSRQLSREDRAIHADEYGRLDLIRGDKMLISILLLAGMLSFVLPTSSAAATRKSARPQRIEQLNERMSALEQDIHTRLEMQDKLVTAKVGMLTAATMSLNNGRKEVDWWLSSLAVVLAFISILVIIIPYLLRRNERETFMVELRRVNDAFSHFEMFERDTRSRVQDELNDMRATKFEIREYMKDAKLAATKVQQLSEETEKASRIIIEGKTAQELGAAAGKLRDVKNNPVATLVAKALEFANAGDWREAAARWAALTDLAPGVDNYWFNLGYSLRKVHSYSKAVDAYAQTTRLKPDLAEAWNNWGTALCSWARRLPEAEQAAKFAEAGEKYAEAARLKPDLAEAWSNWGSSLMCLARALPEPEQPAKFAEAKELLLRAEQVKAGAGAYNLACLYSLSKQPDEARNWLRTARQHNHPIANDCDHLQTDSDLNNLRGLDWFEAFVAEACSGK